MLRIFSALLLLFLFYSEASPSDRMILRQTDNLYVNASDNPFDGDVIEDADDITFDLSAKSYISVQNPEKAVSSGNILPMLSEIEVVAAIEIAHNFKDKHIIFAYFARPPPQGKVQPIIALKIQEPLVLFNLRQAVSDNPYDDDIVEGDDGLFFDPSDETFLLTQILAFSAVVISVPEFAVFTAPPIFGESKAPLSRFDYSVCYSRPPPKAGTFCSIFSYDLVQNFYKISLPSIGISAKSVISSVPVFQDFSLKISDIKKLSSVNRFIVELFAECFLWRCI